MTFSSAGLLDTDPCLTLDLCVPSSGSFSETCAAHKPLQGISPHTSAEKNGPHLARGFHARHYRRWASVSSHPHPHRSVPCPTGSRSRAERFLESLANHPKKNRRMLPASEQVYPLMDYINIDINCKRRRLRHQNDPRRRSRTTEALTVHRARLLPLPSPLSAAGALALKSTGVRRRRIISSRRAG